MSNNFALADDTLLVPLEPVGHSAPRWITSQDERHSRFSQVVRTTNHMRRIYQRELKTPYLTALTALDLIIESDATMQEIEACRSELGLLGGEAVKRVAAWRAVESDAQAQGQSSGPTLSELWRLNLLCACHCRREGISADRMTTTYLEIAQRERQRLTKAGPLSGQHRQRSDRYRVFDLS